MIGCKVKAPSCPADMARLMLADKFPLLVNYGRLQRGVYTKQQKRVREVFKNWKYERDGELPATAKDDLPPCVNCPPAVFVYCQANSAACKLFEIYTVKGRCVTCKKCTHRMSKVKRTQPEIEGYCTGDKTRIKAR